MDTEIDYDGYTTTDYNYGIEDPHSIFYWNELIPTLVVYGITFVLGLIGNCLIIFATSRYRRMKSVTNIFLSSLASSDLLLIIVCIPVKVAKLFSYTWGMGYFVCKFVHYMQNVSAICSVLTLTAISIERYYAIIHPMKAKYICTISHTKRIILIIWVLSFNLAIPTLIAQVHLPVGLDNNYYWCVKNWDWKLIWRFHEIYMLVLILILPFLIMAFCYTLICWEVWKVMERRSVMTSEHALKRHNVLNESIKLNENFTDINNKIITKTTSTGMNINSSSNNNDTHMMKQVICMLVAVILLFAICWTPLLVDNVLTAYDILEPLRIGRLKYMSTTFHLLAYFNSCINPIVYGFMSKNFRESFAVTLCWLSKKKAFRGRSYSMKYISRSGSQTRNTSIR